MAEKCPHHQVDLVDGRCPTCEWAPPTKGRRDRRASTGPNDGGCDFHLNGSRCEFPGTFSSNVREGGPWYCRWHSEPGNRKQDAAQHEFFRLFVWHENSVQHRAERMRDWYPNAGRHRREIEEFLARYPDVQRRPGESRTEYADRMRADSRRLMGARIVEADRLRETEVDPA